MRPVARSTIISFALTGVLACNPPEPTVGAADTTSVATEDSLDVPVLPVARLESEPENRLEVGITYPQLNPSAAPELATVFDVVNANIAARIAAEVDSFLVAARFAATHTENLDDVGLSSLEGTYSDPFVNERIFSASQEIYRHIVGAGHPTTTTVVYNYDLGTGAQLNLDDLFNGATAYLDTLSVQTSMHLVAEAEERGFDPLGLYVERFGPILENFARFTLSPDSLRLHFPPDTVAPYVAGPFTVSLAYSDLMPTMTGVGPAATLGND